MFMFSGRHRDPLRPILALGLGVFVHAGPPFQTDDPEPVPLGHSEFYVASLGQENRGGRTGSLPLLEFNFGIFRNAQIHLVTPFGYGHPAQGLSVRGYGDTELGLKYRVLDESGVLPQVGTFIQIELPTGDAARGLGSGHTMLGLPVWIQKSWGAWTSYGGYAWWRNPGAGNRNFTFAGWLLQRQVTGTFALGVEAFHRSAQTLAGLPSTGYNLGAVLDLSSRHHLLLSLGRNFRGALESHFYIGYQLTLGHPDSEPH